MDDRGSQPVQAGDMFLSAVTFMFRQPVTRTDSVKLSHQVVTSYFGDDGGTGNGEAETIAINQSFLRQGYLRQAQIIDKKVMRGWGKLVYRLLHGDASRPDYPQSIDYSMAGHTNAD